MRILKQKKQNRIKFSDIENVLSRTHRSANVARLSTSESKIILAYRLPDFSEMDSRDADNLFRRINKLDLGFQIRFVIQVDDGLILFDQDENVRGYTYNLGQHELFNEFDIESIETPSHTIDHIIEMQRMMNQHFKGGQHE